MEISCIVFFPTVESEALEVQFVELSEDSQETKEVFQLITVVEGVSNLAGTQGKPRCIYTYDFYNYFAIIKICLFHDCALA